MATIITVPAQYTITLNQGERDDLESVVMRSAVADGPYGAPMRLAEALFGDTDEGFVELLDRYRAYQR